MLKAVNVDVKNVLMKMIQNCFIQCHHCEKNTVTSASALINYSRNAAKKCCNLRRRLHDNVFN